MMEIKEFSKTDRKKNSLISLATTLGIMIIVALFICFYVPQRTPKDYIIVIVFLNSFVFLAGMYITLSMYFTKKETTYTPDEIEEREREAKRRYWKLFNKFYIRYPVGAFCVYLAFDAYKSVHVDNWLMALIFALFVAFCIRETVLVGLLLWGIYYLFSFVFAKTPIGIAIIITVVILIIGLMLLMYYFNLKILLEGSQELSQKLNELEYRILEIESKIEKHDLYNRE